MSRIRILAVGDIIGKIGFNYFISNIKEIKEKNNIDFVIINGENTMDNFGLKPKEAEIYLQNNVNVITSGNHIWHHREIFKNEKLNNFVLRPANYGNNAPGKGFNLFEFNLDNKIINICVINLQGRTFQEATDNPFKKFDQIYNSFKEKTNIFIVDFHGEATSEKKAFGYYVGGRASMVYGTHTHVQTADETIMDSGTGYITDIGMTGPKNSVIGMDINKAVSRYLNYVPIHFRPAEGLCIFNGIVFDIDIITGKTVYLKRLFFEEEKS